MRTIRETAFGFEDTETKGRVKCAYSLKDICTRDCAACNVHGADQIARCQRGSREPFTIGRVVDDPTV